MRKKNKLVLAAMVAGAVMALAAFPTGYLVESTAYAYAQANVAPMQVQTVLMVSDEAIREAPISTSTAALLIKRAAKKWGVDYQQLLGTLNCESRLDEYIVGDGGTSFGIAQFHFPTDWKITKAQALDAAFSIDFAAQKFAQGAQSHWTCWRKLYGNRKATN